MKKTATLDQARQLISERQFAQALKTCDAIIRGKCEDAEVYILAAACQLCVGAMEKDAKKRERIRKAVSLAFARAGTAEEAQKTEQRLLSAMNRWRTEQMTAMLRRQKDKISLPELKNYYDLILKYDRLPDMIREEARTALDRCGGSEQVEAELQAERERAEALAQQEYEIACSAFGEAKMTVRFHAAGNASQVSAILRSVIEMLTVAQVLARRSSTAGSTDDRRQRLEKESEILQFGLSAMLHPDGKSIQLYSSGRDQIQEQLDDCRAQLDALDAPQAPDCSC